jgi:hypothetical protein
MLARFRSLRAVYDQQWQDVVNFFALDKMSAEAREPVATKGVSLAPWNEQVPDEDQHLLRWYPMLGAWNYLETSQFKYGDDTSYVRGMAFLDGHGNIEDWGCGFAHARNFVHAGSYVGIDGSGTKADRLADLQTYTSRTSCVFMRHVLEHNANWRTILGNALASFEKRMVLVIFTPFGPTTRIIATSNKVTTVPVPDISFRRADLIEAFGAVSFREESLRTDTQYGVEHIFYLEK